MARPILKRTLKTYERDIASLRRLRVAIALDASLDKGRAAFAIREIDKCIQSIQLLTISLNICA